MIATDRSTGVAAGADGPIQRPRRRRSGPPAALLLPALLLALLADCARPVVADGDADADGDELPCSPECEPPELCCGGACVDPATDPANCGACGADCEPGGDRCVSRQCSCNGAAPCAPERLCCGAEGCVDPMVDPDNCGACGVVCSAAQTCSLGECRTADCDPACAPGETCCAGAGCVETARDPDNCGRCGERCREDELCLEGRCSEPLCDPACGAGETCCGDECAVLGTSDEHCGGCWEPCPPVQGRCSGGVCRCGSGAGCEGTATETCCDGRCVDLTRDADHCTGCEMPCAEGERCDGTCRCGTGPACRAGQTCCSEACVELSSDEANCGRCGQACLGADQCVGGACVCPYAEPPAACGPGTLCCPHVLGIGGGCVNPLINVLHCGRCNNSCPMPGLCVAGTCV